MLQYKEKKKATAFGINLMIIRVLYQAAQNHASVLLHVLPLAAESTVAAKAIAREQVANMPQQRTCSQHVSTKNM